MTKPVTYHNPPAQCDICAGHISSVFYDAKLPAYGSWANLCHSCFTDMRCSLGTGKGQKYVNDGTGKFVKVEG